MEYYIKTEPGVDIFVQDINPCGGKTILMIHGWPANHRMFEYQYDSLGKKGYRLIGVDTRGFGNSSKPWDGYCFDRLADDIRCVIDALKLRNITLLGHSNGGGIALRYMGRHSGHGVSRLVLCAAVAPSLIKRCDFPYGADPRDIERLIQGTYEDRPQMLRDFGEKFFYKKVSPAFSDWFFQLGLEAAGWATAAIAKMWLYETLFRDMSEVRVPTLIMHGVHDEVVPYELGVIQSEGISCSRLIPFEQSGHGLFYEEKEKFNHELECFIN